MMTKLSQMKFRAYPFLIAAVGVMAAVGGSFHKV
jgi:hypothetical protein